MTEEIIKHLAELKEIPNSGKIDHILILHNLYWEYSDGMTELKPLAMFYLNGFDDLPALKEKHLWNTENYNELMKPFYESHSELIKIVDKLLTENGN
jgi:hypothetical protein